MHITCTGSCDYNTSSISRQIMEQRFSRGVPEIDSSSVVIFDFVCVFFASDGARERVHVRSAVVPLFGVKWSSYLMRSRIMIEEMCILLRVPPPTESSSPMTDRGHFGF
jgi:hypothetical protein